MFVELRHDIGIEKRLPRAFRVARVEKTDLSKPRISQQFLPKAIKELHETPIPVGRIRRAGGGRWQLVEVDPGLTHALESLVEPLTRGDPMSPLRWTCKSTRTLANELRRAAHPVSHEKVAQLLWDKGYSLRAPDSVEDGWSRLAGN